MYFKKLEVYGFKSFADKLTLEFGDGVTAIVGPNGCGKSNVADCIRWALGEQSPKTLRGSNMQDVIFNGSANRKSLSYCEVLLYFDNSERIFDIDYEEVVISRKLYRDGESEYAINKTPCRLKDIMALLHDTGLGKGSYSIIGQGRIDEILSAKPEDRRIIFEEAAGIAKYKNIKIENERKLQRAEEKLATHIAIMSELERNLEPLKAQSEKAQKYLELKKRQKILDINNYIVLYETAEEKKRQAQKALDAVNEEIAKKQQEYDQAYDAYIQAMEHSGKLDTDIKALNDERLSLSLKLERAESEQKLIREKINYLKEQNEKLSAQLLKDQAELEDSKKALDENIEKSNQLNNDIENLRSQIEDLNAKYIEISSVISELESQAQIAHKQELEALNKITDIKSQLSSLAQRKTNLEEKIGEYTNRIQNLTSRLTEDEIRAIKLAKNVETLELERSKLKSNLDALTNQYNTQLKQTKDLANSTDSLSAQYHKLKTQHKLLSDIAEDMRNYSYSVKSLFNAAKTDSVLAKHIENVVARVIKVKPHLETAIEMALGAAAQNIITPDEQGAKYAVNYLKQHNLGRATFLPVSAVQPRYLEQHLLDKIKNFEGCYGVAADLIDYNPRYDGIIRMLLGRTVIAKDLDTAVNIAKSCGYAFKIVTLDGDIIAYGGAITGGSKKREVSNLLSYENELEKVSQLLKDCEQRLTQALKQKTAAEQALESLNQELKKCQQDLHVRDVELTAEKEQYKKALSQIENYKREILFYSQEIQKAQVDIEGINENIKILSEQEKNLSTNKQAEDSQYAQKQSYLDELKTQREALLNKITNAKVDLAAFNTQKNACDNEINRLSSRIKYLEESIAECKKNIKANNDVIETADLPLIGGIAADPKDHERLKEIEAKLQSLDDYKLSFQKKLIELDEARLKVQEELNLLKEKRFECEKRLNDIDISLQIDSEKIAEEYNLDYQGCLEFRLPDYDYQSGAAEANRIKREIVRLGHVNLEAIEEYRVLKERLEEQAKQKEDLEKSIADIRKVIKEMVNEMITRFNHSFEQIKINFSQVFRQLFDGGNAKLILEEAEDPLQAGIEIIAEPPGKKLQSISLLSGGERALTAIAILFAILKLKPMPFCVLDEIEAALDDANAERFARFLKTFSQKTQFIVITHKKSTMEIADRMYGVTMEEQGVSKVVSVKLEEAVKVAQVEGA
ncbi:MAG TPA: chromosome segregation protein SMC [Clostridia bacterium]